MATTLRNGYVQARLEGQQAALRLRLKQALGLAKAPRTHVDTLTIADKAIALLDGVLEVTRMLSALHALGHVFRLHVIAVDILHGSHAWLSCIGLVLIIARS